MILTYNDVGIEVDGAFFPVENAVFSSQSSAEPNRATIATSLPARWGHSGPRKNTISLRGFFVPECKTFFLDKTGESTGFMINYGGMRCENAQLTSLKYSVSPFSPVSFEAEFSVFGEIHDAPDGTLFGTPEYPTGYVIPWRYNTSRDLAHGLFTEYSGFNTPECIANPFSINVSYDFERRERYKLGSRYPDRVALTRAEKTVSVDGDGWDHLISFQGNDVTGAIGIASMSEAWGYDFSASGAVFGHAFVGDLGYTQLFRDFVTSGKIIQQSLQFADVLKGSFTIKEVLY